MKSKYITIFNAVILTAMSFTAYASDGDLNTNVADFYGGNSTNSYLQNAEIAPSSGIEDPYIHISDNGRYFIGKTKNRNLWNIMERITADTLPSWQRFAAVQVQAANNGRIMHYLSPNGGNLIQGSGHFELVLRQVSIQLNEVWIAYVVDYPLLGKCASRFDHYDYDFLVDMIEGRKGVNSDENTFAKALKMFVTAVSTPKAKIISNMGICKTIESLLFPAEKDISMDLLSFTAKAMLILNPERRYMINAPTAIMAMMILKHVEPVFFGTKESMAAYKHKKDLSFEEYIIEQQDSYDVTDSHFSAKEALRRFKKKLEAFTTTEEISQFFLHDCDAQTYLEEDSKDGYTISPLKLDVVIRRRLMSSYEKRTHHGYEAYKKAVVDMDSFLEKHPPIISVDNIKSAKSSMVIYDDKEPMKPWLSIKKDDPDYDWIFTNPFEPAHITHYIAVDLQALAQSRPLDTIASWKHTN